MNTKVIAMIADDHPGYRAGLKEVILNIPCVSDVLEARNGNEIFEHPCFPEVAILLLDLAMPVKSGYEVLNELAKLPLCVIVNSLHLDLALLNKHLQSPLFQGYLLKSDSIVEVKECFDKVLSGQVYFSKEVRRALEKRAARHFGTLAPESSSSDLTKREKEVLRLICMEQSNKEIAEQLNMSEHTIKDYRKRLKQKSGALNTAGLVMFALRHGIYPN